MRVSTEVFDYLDKNRFVCYNVNIMNNTEKFYSVLNKNYKVAKDVLEKLSTLGEPDELALARLTARVDTYEYILTLFDIFVKENNG